MTTTHHITGLQVGMGTVRDSAHSGVLDAWRMNETRKHPALIAYGAKTLSQNFPLALVVGREPQVDEEVAAGVGSYDFTAHPRCAFWNIAYRLMARSTGQPEFGTAAFKQECVQRKASPILFADALPIGLSNRNDARAKHLQRSEVSDEAADRHVKGIFELDIMKRVQLVILSGHQAPQFQYATNAYREHLRKAGKPFIETAFLYPTNSRKIEAQIEQANGWRSLRALLVEFRNAL